MRAVQFDRYGDLDVLEVRDVDRPEPGPGEVLVAVRAAAINPGEIAIREGVFAEQWPATFPSGEGSDLAGVVEAVGPEDPGFAVGDEVVGWTDARASHAEYVAVPARQLVARPDGLAWEVGGSLFVAGVTAWACVETVAPQAGEVVVVSGAAGGVGSLVVQLVRRTGATVVGLASEANHGWLREHGAVPVTYGEGQAERLRAATDGRIDAWVDCFGDGYADLAIELGVEPQRVNTIIDFAAVERLGIQAQGGGEIASASVLAQVAQLAARGELVVEIAATYPLEDVREAYARLADRHTRGKLVLVP